MNNLQRVLTMKGYAVRKDSLTEEKQREIRRELTVTPVTQSKFGGGAAAAPFAVYYESQQRFYLPRHWAIPLYGPPEADILPEGEALPSSVMFTGNPFDYQLGIIQQFIDAGANGLICVPCGKGKTFMALCIAARLGKRFLVVVDKEFLLNQWKGEMEQFFPGLRVGVLRGTKCETDPTLFDVTLCMIQSLVQKEYPDDTFKSYGFAIFDECHHLGAAQFSRALLKIQTKYMLGLSATPTRDDGLTKVFEWYLGKPVYWEKTREPDTTVVVKAMYFESDKPEYNNVPTNQYGETISAKLLGQVMDFEPRNQWIMETLCALTDEPTRRILVLSQYKRHLNAFEEILKVKRPEVTYSYYVGQMKEHIREEGAKTAQVLLGSYAMASEAMNIKTLNTIVLASPRKKIEQSVGRILRQRPSERSVHPLIVDIIDNHGTFRRQFTKRRAFYTQCGYKIERIFLKKQNKEKAQQEEDDKDTESVGSDTDSEEELVPVYKKEKEPEYAFVDD
jgi:superfamily II DNA or RNA helicase